MHKILTLLKNKNTIPLALLLGVTFFSTTLTLIAAPADSVPLSGITGSISSSVSDHGDNAQTWSWNTLSSNSALTLTSNSTSATNNSQTLLNIALGGVNASTTAQTTYGAKIVNSHRGGASSNGTLNYSSQAKASISLGDPQTLQTNGLTTYVLNPSTQTLSVLNTESPEAITTMGQIATGQNPSDMVVVGSYAYVVNKNSNTLQIFNISSATPTLTSTTATNANPHKVSVSGQYAVIATTLADNSNGTIQLFNISNPANPTLISTTTTAVLTDTVITGSNIYTLSPTSIAIYEDIATTPTLSGANFSAGGTSLTLSGNYAYVVGGTDGSNTLKVVDITNITSPSVSDTTPIGQGTSTTVYIQNTKLFVVNIISNTVTVFDITNPINPAFLGSIQTEQDPHSVSFYNDYLLVSNQGANTLQTFDLAQTRTQTNATNIALSLSATNGTNNYALVIPQGNVGIGTDAPQSLFSIGASSQFQVNTEGNIVKLNNVSVSFPATQGQSNTVLTNDGSGNLSWQEVRRGGGGGTTINNIVQSGGGSGMSAPVGPVGELVKSGFNSQPSVAVSGNYAYETASGIRIIDISNPSNPTSTNTISGPNFPSFLKTSGSYLYAVSVASSTLEIFNISTPATPTLVSTTSTASGPSSVAISGNYAYVTNYGAASFQIFNISTPATPTLVSTTSTASGPYSITTSGSYVYVVSYDSNSLQTFNVSNPAAPTLVSTITPGSRPTFVIAEGSYLYVSNQLSSTFKIFDISTPATPTLVSTVSTADGSYSLAVSGNYVYTVNTIGSTLQAFDISDPQNPEFLGSVGTTTSSTSVMVSNSYAYVSGSLSFQIFDTSDFTSSSGGSSPTLNTLLGATGTNAIDNSNFSQAWSWNTLSSTSGLSLSSTSTAATGNTQKLLDISLSGANANASQTTFGASISNTHTGTGAINVGLSLSASGGSSNYALIAPSGNVGIGTSTPAVTLSVSGPLYNQALFKTSGTTDRTSTIQLENNNVASRKWDIGVGGTGNGLGFTNGEFYLYDYLSGATRFSINTSGNVAFPSLTTDNAGGSDKYLCITTAGQIVTRGTTCGGSSLRFKHDITALSNGLSTITKLNPVSFRYNQTNELRLGLIAEDVKKIDSRLVYFELDGVTPRGVNYQDVIPLLIDSVKELDKKINNTSLFDIESAISSFEEKIVHKTLKVKALITEKVTTDALELRDKKTGNVFCVEVIDGTLVNSLGMCKE